MPHRGSGEPDATSTLPGTHQQACISPSEGSLPHSVPAGPEPTDRVASLSRLWSNWRTGAHDNCQAAGLEEVSFTVLSGDGRNPAKLQATF